MGLTKQSRGTNYVRFKNGAFYLASDLKEQGDNAESYDTLEGQLTSIGLREDTYEGNTIEKLALQIESEGTNYSLQIPFDSVYCSNFISFLKSADVSQTIGLKAVSKKEVRRDGEPYNKVSILVYQKDSSGNDVFMKSYYSKANPNGMPEMKPVELNGKTQWDKTEKLQFERKVVIDEIRPNIKTVSERPSGLSSNTTNVEEASFPLETEEEGLPF